ncbi:MAG TPA: DUF3500 domain-containing protein [Bryobacteraceae bacterium]|nr:DUF3500 domain-containing protein [Bryobacteraceae bacterium]
MSIANNYPHVGEHHHQAPHLTRRALFSTVIPGAILTSHAFPQNTVSMAETFRKMSADYERKGLAEPFKGITANGTVEPGFFGIHPTGVSTAAVRTAAERFLASLTKEQHDRTMFAIDDPEWRKWMNQHFYVRQGVSFREMTGSQRDAAFALLEASLSARGLKLTRDVMRLNETLAELTNDHEFLGEWLYFITVMGKPSATEPWGFQLDGHHAIVNYFVLGDQVVMTPFFVGSEPVAASAGAYKGISILQDEQNRGLDMLLALDKDRRAKAILNPKKTENYNLTEAFKDNVVIDYAGTRVAEFSLPERRQLLDLVELYVGNMDDGHARVKMDEVKRQIDRTYFAWIGGSDSTSVYYYRIHSPVILIEFDHQRPANLARFSKNPKLPTRQHIHCVVRTPNGNDYGKDLLRQHYQSHAHA